MSDIDDELLALAGGGGSDDEGSVRPSRASSASPPPEKTKRAPAKKAKRRARHDDSEDEGEASSAPSSPNSLESAPMDESDSDAELPAPPPAGDDDEDKYPVDGLYVSQAERAEINNMPELDREQLLADRRDLVERQRQNRLLRQMVTNFEKEERKQGKKKRSADTAELEDADRRSSKARTGKPRGAMEALRQARADKQKRKEDHENRRDTYTSRDRDYRDDDDSEGDFARERTRSPEVEPEREAPPAELRDYERVRLGRNEFAQVCFTPGFDSAITGCFIRIALGPHPETGIEQYRMASIKGFSKGREYAITGPNGPFVTDQYVRAAHGKAAKEFPFIAASSGRFTDSELNRYVVQCSNDGVALPTQPFLNSKIDEINGLINHKWTSEEIKARLARRSALKKPFDPAERQRVARQLEEARDKGDDDRADALQDELHKLSTSRLAFKTSLGPSKVTDSPKGTTEQERLAERNRENRRMNVEAVRKAQLKEKARAREIAEALKRGETIQDDPSRRLKTKAKFVHDINESHEKKSTNGSGASTPANGTPKVGATKQTALPHLSKLREEKHAAEGLPTIHKPLMDDDVIGALDLDIDVEI